MKFALIIDGVVKQVQPYFQDGFIEVGDDVCCEMLLVDGEFINPPIEEHTEPLI